MEDIPQPEPRTVEDVFNHFKGRRAGLIKALTTDVEKFRQQSDSEKQNLCLYGRSDGSWEVNPPVKDVHLGRPEALGINIARDGMQEKDWLSLVAVHSDSWLLAVAFYFEAPFKFGKNERKSLFEMINDLPSIYETVEARAKEAIPGREPRTVEDLFNDFKGMRAGLIKALTTDVEKFRQQSDPEKPNLCLYGHSDESWEVNPPVKDVHLGRPEPALGIIIARDGMQEKVWLSLVAVHSDSWLLAVAFYGARFEFDKIERKRLFEMINDLPSIYETVSEKQDRFCGACGDDPRHKEFFIRCDTCKVWFHINCVKITFAKYEDMEEYKCPGCCIEWVMPKYGQDCQKAFRTGLQPNRKRKN